MKNINTFLSAAIALAITLCASSQVMAMNEGPQVNPYLSQQDKEFLYHRIKEYEAALKHWSDPKYNYLTQQHADRKERIENLEKKIKDFKTIYYGNKAYSLEEMIEIIEQ